MKLCNFWAEKAVHLGVFQGETLLDLTASGYERDMMDVIRTGPDALREIGGIAAQGGAPVLQAEAVQFANVTRPGKLLCVGLNYNSHAEETGGTAPKEPVLFSKYNDALASHGSPVDLPPSARCFDYEAELVIVMGKTAWNVPEAQAMEYVFGYTCGDDLSARDTQFRSNQWLIGKAFPGFAPAGPCIVTADSFDPMEAHGIQCTVNGVRVQSGVTTDMIFNCAQIISYASQFIRLEPGDLIFTGTPAGVILGHKKGTRVWLKAGDTVSVTIEGIGTLSNQLRGSAG